VGFRARISMVFATDDYWAPLSLKVRALHEDEGAERVGAQRLRASQQAVHPHAVHIKTPETGDIYVSIRMNADSPSHPVALTPTCLGAAQAEVERRIPGLRTYLDTQHDHMFCTRTVASEDIARMVVHRMLAPAGKGRAARAARRQLWDRRDSGQPYKA
jgi:hypothetical protein